METKETVWVKCSIFDCIYTKDMENMFKILRPKKPNSTPSATISGVQFRNPGGKPAVGDRISFTFQYQRKNPWMRRIYFGTESKGALVQDAFSRIESFCR